MNLPVAALSLSTAPMVSCPIGGRGSDVTWSRPVRSQMQLPMEPRGVPGEVAWQIADPRIVAKKQAIEQLEAAVANATEASASDVNNQVQTGAASKRHVEAVSKVRQGGVANRLVLRLPALTPCSRSLNTRRRGRGEPSMSLAVPSSQNTKQKHA